MFQRIHYKVARPTNNNNARNDKKEADEEISNKKGMHKNNDWKTLSKNCSKVVLVFDDLLHSDDKRLIKLLKNLGFRLLRRLS